MRLIMIGTGPFAVPTFRELLRSSHQVAALVTAPLKVRGQIARPDPGGKAAMPPSAVAGDQGPIGAAPGVAIRSLADVHGVPVFDPLDLNSPEARRQLEGYAADLMVVCDYGQILANETLAAARRGGINLHASLLPKYRGAAPINWALFHGETETGVSVIHMTPQVDAGPVIAQQPTAIGGDETAAQLEPRLADLGAGLAARTIDAMERGPLEPIAQDPALKSRAPRLKKTDGQIDWSRPAEAIRNQVRAMDPWPRCYTYWRRGAGAPLRLIVGPLDVLPELSGEPGRVLEASKDRLAVACGQGAVAIRSLQPTGKRVFSIQEFLNGYRLQAGETLLDSGAEQGGR